MADKAYTCTCNIYITSEMYTTDMIEVRLFFSIISSYLKKNYLYNIDYYSQFHDVCIN